MKPSDVEVLARILEYESTHDQKQEWSLGWSWEHVRVHPAVLNRLVVEECLEVVFYSNSYKGYKLIDKGKLLATQGEPQPEVVQNRMMQRRAAVIVSMSKPSWSHLPRR